MKRTSILAGIMVAVAVSIITLPPTEAGASLFIKFAGITGESTDALHNGWSSIASVAWGVSISSSGSAGSGTVTLDNLTWTQLVDKSITALFTNLTGKRRIVNAEVDFTFALEGQSKNYFTMKFDDVYIKSLVINGSSTEKASLSGSFAYTGIEMTYYQYGPSGNLISTNRASYDGSSKGAALGDLAYVYSLGLAGPPSSSTAAPVPAALWLLGSGLAGLCGVRRKLRK